MINTETQATDIIVYGFDFNGIVREAKRTSLCNVENIERQIDLNGRISRRLPLEQAECLRMMTRPETDKEAREWSAAYIQETENPF